jgi:pyrrolidone-carboxylate peptidase
MTVGRVPVALTAAALLAAGAVSGTLVTDTVRASEPQTTAMPTGCYDESLQITVEEQRLTRPIAQRLLEIGGFNPYVSSFRSALCKATSLAAAQRLANESGRRLWRVAVARAQGRMHFGTDDRYDDRPLYWARLSMTKALRQWSPDFTVGSFNSAALVRILDYASRGITSIEFPTGKTTRVLVSGFDPFVLDPVPGGDIRHSNPSGASALQLDGRTIRTRTGWARVQSVMLPVNYTDFDQGIVEDAFGPSLVAGPRRASLIMTISQAVRGEMWIEKWAGDARGGYPDNLRIMQFGQISRAPRWPQPTLPPQWISTALPYRAMIAAKTKPYPVILHRGICEWPDPRTFPKPTAVQCKPNPTRRSIAASGSGGSYLSNESMYRSNRLRIAVGALNVPGGHLHISSLIYPKDPNRVTSPAFEADRRIDVNQVVALVSAAARAVSRQDSSR